MSRPTAPEFRDPVVPWRLLQDYRPAAGVHDEVAAPGGRPRPHCEPLVRSLEALGRHELASRWESAKRAIRDNGVTYNVYGDPQGVDRPWTLDMMPLLIAPAEWSRIEGALLQRSRLLNLILADLYGPQRLLHDGLLPHRSSSPTRRSCGRVTACACRTTCTCTCSPWTSPGLPTGSGG